jgi:hypothetical protein
MSDFERSSMTVDEQGKRRSPGTWFADMGDRLARGFSSFDRPQAEEPEWEYYDEPDQPTAAVDSLDWEPEPEPELDPEPARKRFPNALHGYDRDAVDAHLAALEREMDQLRAQRSPVPSVEAEIERVGEETTAILRVAHEQAAEITRRAHAEADRCVSDAAANAVSMTEDAKRKLRTLDSETDAVWAERGRLIEDVRNLATALFSLAEDAADRFPEEGERGGGTGTVSAPPAAASPKPTAAEPPRATPPRPAAAPPGVAAPPPAAVPPPVAAQSHRMNSAPRPD